MNVLAEKQNVTNLSAQFALRLYSRRPFADATSKERGCTRSTDTFLNSKEQEI